LLGIDGDRPLTRGEEDEFGFTGVAEKLAPSILSLADSDGFVFGIEGPWGSGKTSFLNFLRPALEKAKATHVLNLAPWLIGDSRSLVSTLCDSIGTVLEDHEKSTEKPSWRRRRQKAMKSADLVRSYAARTGRGMVPLAKLAGLVVPGASIAGDALQWGAEALDGLARSQSDTVLKNEISKRIKDSNLRFVVMIDDLDRLEPAQAVEVIRLIRSVADFPRIAYVLCYDREVLAHAMETGLSVRNGDAFLQKIVQLTFTLPLPEPFDLRSSLRRKCLGLYRSVNGRELSGGERSDLYQAIDREGSLLRTPRDAKLTGNGISFIYPAIANEIYFPDLCRAQLIKALQPKLYRWIENYLGLRSSVVIGDAQVSKSERATLGEELRVLLPDADAESTNSIWSLRTFVPGVMPDDQPESRVFRESSDRETEDLIDKKRLGSPTQHRYYFALSAPKAMASTHQLNEIRSYAGKDISRLNKFITGYINADRPYGQSWYEHILQSLDETQLRHYNFNELSGLLEAISTTAGPALQKHERIAPFSVSLSSRIAMLASAIIRRIKYLDRENLYASLEATYCHGDLSWLVGHFHRSQLRSNGLVGGRADAVDQQLFTDAEILRAGSILRDRIAAMRPELLDFHDFAAFVYGWRELSGQPPVGDWLARYVDDDRILLKFLLQVRNWAVGDRVFYPLSRSTIELFFDFDSIVDRLDLICASGNIELTGQVEELRISIEQGSNKY
jgi:hypothetical protein